MRFHRIEINLCIDRTQWEKLTLSNSQTLALAVTCKRIYTINVLCTFTNFLPELIRFFFLIQMNHCLTSIINSFSLFTFFFSSSSPSPFTRIVEFFLSSYTYLYSCIGNIKSRFFFMYRMKTIKTILCANANT